MTAAVGISLSGRSLQDFENRSTTINMQVCPCDGGLDVLGPWTIGNSKVEPCEEEGPPSLPGVQSLCLT